jgi:hypothetical protein
MNDCIHLRRQRFEPVDQLVFGILVDGSVLPWSKRSIICSLASTRCLARVLRWGAHQVLVDHAMMAQRAAQAAALFIIADHRKKMGLAPRL